MDDMIERERVSRTAPKDGITYKNKPFIPWLFRKLGIRYTIQLIFTIVLILVVFFIAIIDVKKYDTRDKAYIQIMIAAKSDDYITIIKSAEAFFSTKILTKNDKRESYVKKLYDKAIVRLFMEQDEQLDENALDHFKKYQHLIVNSKK